MNCLEFRQRLLANPAAVNPALLEHRESCEKCSSFALQLQQQEAELEQAMAVPVPPRLAERVLLANNLRKTRWWPYATAAAIILAITFVGSTFWQRDFHGNASWSEIALAHVLNERSTLHSNASLESSQLISNLAHFGLTLRHDLGRILFLEECDMPGGKGLHVVINSPEAGLVTLIIPPKGTVVEYGSSARDGFAATMTHVGSVAVGIVSDQPANLETITAWFKGGLSPA